MIKPEMIPDEVVKAARQAWLESDVDAMEDWRVAIAAAINAWPRMTEEGDVYHGGVSERWLELPLPQEAGNETVP